MFVISWVIPGIAGGPKQPLMSLIGLDRLCTRHKIIYRVTSRSAGVTTDTGVFCLETGVQ